MSEESRYKPIDTDSTNGSCNQGHNVVNKRTDKRFLKERLSKIVSVYVPNDDAEKVLLRFNDDVDVEMQQQQQDQEERGGSLLQSLEDGLSYEVELLCTLRSVLGGGGVQGSETEEQEDAKVRCSCVSGEKVWICMDGESRIHRLRVTEMEGVVCEEVWLPMVLGETLEPLEIRATRDTVFVSGRVLSQHLIVKYDHHGTVLATTKRYDHPKFGSFDLDRDGHLLLLSPKLELDSTTAQICKLTDCFRSRLYYINLGGGDGGDAKYQPISVAAHGPGDHAWVSLTKSVLDQDSESSEHRLMCFHCCVGSTTQGDKEDLRRALAPNRWRMADHRLGALATLGNYVLGIDQERHNLLFVSWDQVRGQPLVKTISSPGSPRLVHLCSDGSSRAFLFTLRSIFVFKFHEQLIKDSEILV